MIFLPYYKHAGKKVKTCPLIIENSTFELKNKIDVYKKFG